MALINLDKHQKEHALLSLLQPEETSANLAAGLAALGLNTNRLIETGSTSRMGAAEVLSPAGLQIISGGSIKLEPRTVATLESLETVTDLYIPMDVGSISGMIYAIDKATSKSLFRFNGVAFAHLGSFNSDFSIQVVKEVKSGEGTALIVVTQSTGLLPPGAKVYRSINDGATWQVVLTIADSGGSAPSETAWAKGSMIMFGEYFLNTPGRYPRLWYSGDSGNTWSVHTSTTRNGSHTHWIDDIDGSPEGGWFISFGDGSYTGLIKLTLVVGVFTELGITTNGESHCIKKLASGRWIKSEYAIYAFDPLTYGASVKHAIMSDSATGKYPYGNMAYGFRSVFEHRGVLYGCFTNYAVSHPSNGLYVSADDGDTWVCIYRNNSASFGGFRAGFGLDEYIYLQSMSGVGTPAMVRIKAPTAAVVKTLRVDRATRNRVATLGLASFTNPNGSAAASTTAAGGWGTDVSYENPVNGAPSLVEVVTGGFDGSGHQLHFVTKAVDVPGQYNIVSSPALAVLCAGDVPVAGDYFVATARFRAPNFASGQYSIIFYMRGIPTGDQNYRLFSTAGSEWITLVCYGKWVIAPTSWDRLWLRVDNTSADASTNVAFDCYLDAVRLFVSKSPEWVFDNRNGVVGQSVSSDVSIVPIAQEDSGTLLWQITNSAAIEQQDGALASIICAAGAVLTIGYSAQRYTLSDGVTLVQSSVLDRSIDDIVRFAVTYGSEAKLYIQVSSSNGVEVIWGGVKCNRPRGISLGGRSDTASFTAGNYFGLSAYPEEMELPDIIDKWELTTCA